MDRNTYVKVEITRFSGGRIVTDIHCFAHGHRITVSEEFGPFDGCLDVLTAATAFVRGYLMGQFEEVLLADLSSAAGDDT